LIDSAIRICIHSDTAFPTYIQKSHPLLLDRPLLFSSSSAVYRPQIGAYRVQRQCAFQRQQAIFPHPWRSPLPADRPFLRLDVVVCCCLLSLYNSEFLWMPAAVGSSAFKVFMMNDGIGKVALTSIHRQHGIWGVLWVRFFA
jgi:hypothetical protein